MQNHPPKLALLLLPWIGLAAAIGWLAWVWHGQSARINYVSDLAGGSELRGDNASPSGYEDGLRKLILPDPEAEGYEWLLQVDTARRQNVLRLRTVEFDNAPFGREVHSPSPGRWWLATVAWVDGLFSDRNPGQSLERAALLAGPWLQLLFLASVTLFAARHFGPIAAMAGAVLLVSIFPLSTAFMAGWPGDAGLSVALACWSVLPLAVGAGAAEAGGSARRRRFALAGALGALGLWVAPAVQIPVLLGIAIGGAWSMWADRRSENNPSLPWRAWALAGALTSVAAFLLENAPDRLPTLRVTENHPLHALAWLGLGEALVLLDSGWKQGRWLPPGLWKKVFVGLGFVAIFSIPALAVFGGQGSLLPTLPRLANLADTPVADSTFGAFAVAGSPRVAVATLLPLLALAPAVLILRDKNLAPGTRRVLRIGLAVAVPGVLTALAAPGCWQVVDVAAVVLLMATLHTALAQPGLIAAKWSAIAAAVLATLPGLKLLYAETRAAQSTELTASEVAALIERDIAHTLARQVGPAGANVLAPPRLTTSLLFHGGLRGIGTPYRDNHDGFAAAVRIAGATSPDEARALAERRELTHIVMPSWDSFLDEYARLGATDLENTLIGMLHRWLPPRWLAPMAYQMPNVEGFTDDFVAIFRTVELQDSASALAQLAEYFIEMGQIDGARAVGKSLEQSFPGDVAALVARAQIAVANRDRPTFDAIMTDLIPLVENGMDDTLTFDRRVALATVLAQNGSASLASEQVGFCFDEMDERALRGLSTGSLYRLMSLARAYGLEFPDEKLETLALKLLPAEMRQSL